MGKKLKVAVCVSSAFHPELPVKVTLKDGRIETDTKGPTVEAVSCTDRCALEEALRIKRELDDVEVIAVMAGPSGSEWVLESCACFEIDKAVYLRLSDWEPMDSHGCSVVLGDFIREAAPDLVLCGDVNKDFESGQVGPILAEFLNLPYLSRAVGITIHEEKATIEVERKLQRGNRLRLRAPLPCVVSVDTSIRKPRYISVHNRIKENPGRCPTIIPIDLTALESRLNEPIPRVGITSIGPVRLRPKKLTAPTSDMSAQERLAFLTSGGIKKPSNGNKAPIEGTADALARKITEFLKNNFPKDTIGHR